LRALSAEAQVVVRCAFAREDKVTDAAMNFLLGLIVFSVAISLVFAFVPAAKRGPAPGPAPRVLGGSFLDDYFAFICDLFDHALTYASGRATAALSPFGGTKGGPGSIAESSQRNSGNHSVHSQGRSMSEDAARVPLKVSANRSTD
jgi:hypothetical protein